MTLLHAVLCCVALRCLWCAVQSMAVQDPAFKFCTRQQAVRDAPWKDWGGVIFQVVRGAARGGLGAGELGLQA